MLRFGLSPDGRLVKTDMRAGSAIGIAAVRIAPAAAFVAVAGEGSPGSTEVGGRDEAPARTGRSFLTLRVKELLTEQQISHLWVQLFRGGEVTREVIERAEALLDKIRPESPLRHRLDSELRDIIRANRLDIEIEA